MRHFEICNWARYQHYKDRDPTWLKLHRALLSDYEWSQLPDVSKGQLVGLWLVAARCGNRIPSDPVWLANQIGATEPVDLAPIMAGGWAAWCAEESSGDVPADDALAVTTGEQLPGSSKMVQNDTGDPDPVLALARSREKRREEKRRGEKRERREELSRSDHAGESGQAPSFLSFSDEQRAEVEALQRLSAAKRADK
tara:strand:- start:204 stop:794 length:591 start_codon:yes stop_codon:yes gene_type:complete